MVAAGGLEVTGAFATVVPNAGALRLLILEGGLALCADALGPGVAGAARQFDVTHGSITAEMAGNGEIIDGTDVGCFHFVR
jgi:hypothetical protein